MNRKQRIHSAELRRLDHICRSLDRIGNALERLPDTIVSGNNDFVNIGNNNTNQNVGRDGVNVNGSNDVAIQRGDNNNRQGDGDSYARDNSESFNHNSDEIMTNLAATIKSQSNNPCIGEA